MELSIDTSTEIASIALSDKGKVSAEFTWHVGLNHTVQLMAAVTRVIGTSDTSLSRMNSIFVTLGPGSFAGVRVGLAAAKGLCLSLGVPLVGVSTLEADAYPFACTGLPICAIHDAGRGEVAAAHFRQSSGEWATLRKESLTTVMQVGAETAERTVFCGELTEQIAAHLHHALGDRAVIPGASARMRRAGFLAELAWTRLQRGQVDDIATVQPIYVRHPHVTISTPPPQPV